ncbi:Putative RlpA-like domain superfamily protein [Colletotrichum destructivum]|uniref:RlpA-like domain superfamily protein n=1 Tax=Colletotrichum destructivum TaxID=34406 RepID=A0AAX4J428_9PEZI|nr:Putative RlpA-like domain superfamily protein [Colletotrichum destructivum]
MFSTTLTTFLAASASLVSAASIPIRNAGKSGSASVTPHDAFSSSIGVLGCKIDINRVAYWPGSVGCDDICVKVSNAGRSVHLLRIDQSGGAFDISYDAWNYLSTGQSATDAPTQGGGVPMDWEAVPASECEHLLTDGKLPLSAANSMNYLSSCLAQPESFVAKNHALYNIQNSACTWGVDELCDLDLAVSNQASCPSGLGITKALTNLPVENIAYGTGKLSVALQ